MLDHFGWGSWGPSMIGFSLTGCVLMLFLWNARPKVTPTVAVGAVSDKLKV